ncbi:CapA family protein [Candidatus Saccharibacteria bacterium]|nr:CapA family protein [Candidatus Saccharibacteria bacterium]
MARKKRNRVKYFLVAIILFVVMFGGAFFGIQFFTKTGVFRIPGVVYYDESLSEDEIQLLKNIFTEEVDLDKDVTISAKYSLEKPTLSDGEYLYRTEVPVTDFYSLDTNITVEDPTSLFVDGSQSEIDFSMIDINELDASKKLLSINDKYYLDDFNSGAIFRTIKFDSEKFDDEIKPLVDETFTKTFPEKSSVLSFAQTGVTALSRDMNAKLVAVGGDAKYFAENIKDFLSSFDLTHTSNESSFTTFANSSNICSDTRFIDTLTAIGLDIVELTGNHNQDCGIDAALNTIDIYEQNSIKMVGGGRNAEEAAKPLNISEKGTNITFLAYNQSTGGATYGNTPGANQYYEENAVAEINAAKERGDFVIVDVQYYECSAYASEYEDPICDKANSSAGDQIGFFRHLIDLGADVVVGTSAHQPQTFELYGNGAIYYGLGNLFFDQVWWPGTTRSLVLAHYFYNGKLLQTKIVPTVYDKTMQTKLLDEETTKWFLGRLISVKP